MRQGVTAVACLAAMLSAAVDQTTDARANSPLIRHQGHAVRMSERRVDMLACDLFYRRRREQPALLLWRRDDRTHRVYSQPSGRWLMTHCRRLIVIAGATLAATVVVGAHDFWLVPDAFSVAPDEEISIRGQTSSAFPTSESAVTVDRVTSARVLGAND